MPTTHILVDYENVQPAAADIALVRGEGLRLAIFRGPGQMKYAADVAEAWQPLGANLSFVRCAKAGRNAVDMHIAFYLGELVAAQRAAGGDAARFVIVSRDTDFDPLLLHIRALGFDAARVTSIKAALPGGAAERAEPRAAKSRASRAGKAAARPAPPPEPPKPAAKKTAAKRAARKSPPPAPSAAKNAPPAKAAARAATPPAPPAAKKAPPPARAAQPAAAPADERARVIDSLRRMGDKRPARRAGLERHIESHLGRNLEPGRLQALMAQLERDGVLAFNDTKVEYRLPRARK